jgi:hypothetical protein
MVYCRIYYPICLRRKRFALAFCPYGGVRYGKLCLSSKNNYESEFEDDDEDKFINFVTRLLRCRAHIAPLKVLNIYSNQSQDKDYWIKYARKKSVESLQIGDITRMESNFILG